MTAGGISPAALSIITKGRSALTALDRTLEHLRGTGNVGAAHPNHQANCFCICTNCGFAHNKKVFDCLGEGDYYIIESGGRGWGSSQLRALLESSPPRPAVEYSLDNHEVLENPNSMERWISLFRFLIDAKTQGAARSKPGLKGFTTRAHAEAFTTPLRDNTRRPQDNKDDGLDALGVETGPTPFCLQDAIMGVQGELGVWSASAPYPMIHGGLKILSKELVALDKGVMARV